jgi:hypothetical protein
MASTRHHRLAFLVPLLVPLLMPPGVLAGSDSDSGATGPAYSPWHYKAPALYCLYHYFHGGRHRYAGVDYPAGPAEYKVTYSYPPYLPVYPPHCPCAGYPIRSENRPSAAGVPEGPPESAR